MTTSLNFEIICVDTLSRAKVKTEVNFLHLLLSNFQLWESAKIKNNLIQEDDKSITCMATSISSESDNETNPQISFLLSITGQYNKIESFRLKILGFIKDQGFDHCYVIKDDISKNIACELYPLVHEVENSLRGYLIRFFVGKLGVRWWDLTSDNEMKTKVNQRKNNEKDFSKYIDNKAYLIDFGELGKIIYALSSGYINKDDILRKIQDLDESIESIRSLKTELQTNYSKFFKENFKDNNFQQKWESIEKIRHKIAHNNLFIQDDLVSGKKDCESLIKIISDAKNELQSFNFTEEEKNNIVENSTYNTNELYGEFIKEWKSFSELLDSIASRLKLTKGGRLYNKNSIKSLFLLVFENGENIITEDLYSKIKYLIDFRNRLVHNPGDLLIETNLPNSILDLKEIINILKEHNNSVDDGRGENS